MLALDFLKVFVLQKARYISDYHNFFFIIKFSFFLVVTSESHLHPKVIFFLTCRRIFNLSVLGWSSWKRISSLDTETLPLSKFHFLSCWVIINYVTVTFCKVSSVGGSELEVREYLPQKWTCQGWSLAGFWGHGKCSSNDNNTFYLFFLSPSRKLTREDYIKASEPISKIFWHTVLKKIVMANIPSSHMAIDFTCFSETHSEWFNFVPECPE